jgi:hypothetical protein
MADETPSADIQEVVEPEVSTTPEKTKRSSAKSRQFMAQADLEKQANNRVLLVGRVLMVALTLAMLAIVFRVGQLQTQPPEPIARLVNSQNSTVTLIPRRGSLVAVMDAR